MTVADTAAARHAFPLYKRDSPSEVDVSTLCYIKLFEKEIRDIVNHRHKDVYTQFVDIFGQECIDKFLDRAESSDQEVKFNAQEAFIKRCFISTEATVLLDEIVRKYDETLHHYMHGTHIDQKCIGYAGFRKYFLPDDNPEIINTIGAILDMEGLHKELKDDKGLFEKSMSPFRDNSQMPLREQAKCWNIKSQEDSRLIKYEYDVEYLAHIFLRNLPYCYSREKTGISAEKGQFDDDWVFKVIQALSRNAQNRAVLLYLMPDYQIEIEARRVLRKEMTRKKLNPDEEADLAEDMVIDCRRQDSVKSVTRKRWQRDNEESNGSNDADISLRAYQSELSERAAQGENTVIVAPTGSGKTVVAANIARSHLLKKEESGKPGRVIFIVPKVPLVLQQVKQFNRYLKNKFLVNGLHGNQSIEEESRADLVLASHVIVVTPQVLINMLRSVRRSERLYLCDITLLMFDECHHTVKESAYNVLMDYVHEYNNVKPQIVGMTASLGLASGKTALSEESALNHIYTLLASLDAKSLSTVNKWRDELDKYVQLPVDEVKRVNRPPEGHRPFATALKNFMSRIESKIRDELIELTKTEKLALRHKDVNLQSFHKCPTRYQQMVASLEYALKRYDDLKLKKKVLPALGALRWCCSALEIDDLMPSKYAYEYLDEGLNEFRQLEGSGWIMEIYESKDSKYTSLHKLLESNSESAFHQEIVTELIELIQGQLIKKSDSRIIVFVTERAAARRLCKYLNSEHKLEALRTPGSNDIAGVLTSSQAQARKAGGQTADEQEENIRKFNKGEIKVIVATSVAEEGLDVQECNMVIKYNNTGSSVSMMQRRGRARAKDSRSVLLVISDAVEQRELENRLGEKIMNNCIKQIHRMSEPELDRKTKNSQDRRRREKEAEREQEEERKTRLDDKIFKICCSHCDSHICNSDDMRNANTSNKVICCRDIWRKIAIGGKVKVKSIDDVTQILGDAICIGCNNTIGTVIHFAGVYLVTLRISAVKLEGDGIEEGRNILKKWKDTEELFYMREITETELRLMGRAISDEEEKEKLLIMAKQRLAAETDRVNKQRAQEEEKRLNLGVKEWTDEEDNSEDIEKKKKKKGEAEWSQE